MIFSAPVKELSDYWLARLLLGYLSHAHGVGGVSLGRSKASTMLEAAMSLMPPLPDDLDADRWREADLELEAMVRVSRSRQCPLQMTLFPELEWQSNAVLIYLILGQLHLHYLERAAIMETTQDWSPCQEEPLALLAMLLLIPDDDFPPELGQASMMVLVRVARGRARLASLGG